MLSVSKWRRILRGKTETKSAPKIIFSGNGNGLRNFTFLSTREQKNVHTVYVKQDGVCVCFVNVLIETQNLRNIIPPFSPLKGDYTLKNPGSDLTWKRVREGQTHFGVRPTRNPGQTDPESESERHF